MSEFSFLGKRLMFKRNKNCVILSQETRTEPQFFMVILEKYTVLPKHGSLDEK